MMSLEDFEVNSFKKVKYNFLNDYNSIPLCPYTFIPYILIPRIKSKL